MTPPLRLLMIATLAVELLTAACSSGGPSPSGPSPGSTSDGAPDVLVARLDAGAVADAHSADASPILAGDGGADTVVLDGSGGAVDWSNCGMEGALPEVSTADFCSFYLTTSCPRATAGFADRAACAVRYDSYNDDQKACAAYSLCRAATLADFCPLAVAPAGPCNLP